MKHDRIRYTGEMSKKTLLSRIFIHSAVNLLKRSFSITRVRSQTHCPSRISLNSRNLALGQFICGVRVPLRDDPPMDGHARKKGWRGVMRVSRHARNIPLCDVYRALHSGLLGRCLLVVASRRRKLGSPWVVVLRAALRTLVCLTFSSGEEFLFIASLE